MNNSNTAPSKATRTPKGGLRAQHKKDTLLAYLFLSPSIIGFICFIGGPIILSFVLIFVDYNLIQPPEFIGMANIKRFLSDPQIPIVFLNTLKFLLILPIVHCAGGLVLAYLVSRVRIKFLSTFFRNSIYFPAIITTASVAIAWGYIFATDTGVLNYYVRQFGYENIRWLTDPNMAYVTIAIFSFWKFIGTTFLYYIIGLSNIPDVYYEAAQIDGASSTKTFFKITLPLLTPTMFFVIITNLIGVFQIFDEPYLLTNGGPGTATKSVAVYIYETAFRSMNIGYGATVALSLFLIILTITIIQFTVQNKWVNYGYE